MNLRHLCHCVRSSRFDSKRMAGIRPTLLFETSPTPLAGQNPAEHFELASEAIWDSITTHPHKPNGPRGSSSNNKTIE